MVVVVVEVVVVVDDVEDVVVSSSKISSGSSWSSSKVLPIDLGVHIDRFSVVSSITVQLYRIYVHVKRCMYVIPGTDIPPGSQIDD